MSEKINPIRLKFEDGREYTIEFNRETVAYAEDHGFKRDDIGDRLMTRIPELFFYGFRMHHPDITKEETDKILFDDLGGLYADFSDRLMELFFAPYDYITNEEGKPKNSKLTVLL